MEGRAQMEEQSPQEEEIKKERKSQRKEEFPRKIEQSNSYNLLLPFFYSFAAQKVHNWVYDARVPISMQAAQLTIIVKLVSF